MLQPDEFTDQPLHQAALAGDAATVARLLKGGMDPDVNDTMGETPLMRATTADVARQLIEAGADVHARCKHGDDAFKVIIEDEGMDFEIPFAERVAIGRVLMDAGVSLEHDSGGSGTRLLDLADAGFSDGVQLLLALGADASVRTKDGKTPLHALCWNLESDESAEPDERAIRALVDAGAEVDAKDNDGRTPLHAAAQGDGANPPAVAVLLKLSADPDPADHAGITPLMLAAESGCDDCAELLCEAGADPCRSDQRGETAIDKAEARLQMCREAAAPGDEKCLKDRKAKLFLSGVVQREAIARAEKALVTLRQFAAKVDDGT